MLLKTILKLILPYLVQWLVLKAEEKFNELKKGSDKKAYVVNTISDFVEKNEDLKKHLNPEKLDILIEKKVIELINKIPV